MHQLWYCVCQDHEAKWHIVSFMSKTAASERKIALINYKRVALITNSFKFASDRRRILEEEDRQKKEGSK